MDDELEMGAVTSMRSWTMTALPGVPLPPNRSLHERNDQKAARREFSVHASKLAKVKVFLEQVGDRRELRIRLRILVNTI